MVFIICLSLYFISLSLSIKRFLPFKLNIEEKEMEYDYDMLKTNDH